jgi:hypothetical protein
MNNHGHADTAGVEGWCVEAGWEGYRSHRGTKAAVGVMVHHHRPAQREVLVSFALCADLARSLSRHTAGGHMPSIGAAGWPGYAAYRPNKMEVYRRISSCYHRVL